jgi:uncharacterized membrane protein YdjX (TVP38/TMEM64 family)
MTPRRIAIAAFTIIILGLAGWGVYEMGFKDFMEWVRQFVNDGTPAHVFLAMALFLPIAGVPLSLFLVLGGTKFGIAWGLVMLAALIPGQLAVFYWLGNSLARDLVKRLLSRTRYELPPPAEKNPTMYAASVAVIPGVSYTLKCLAVAFAGVPFKNYFAASWPLHFAMGVPFVVLGGGAQDMNPWLLGAGVVGVFAVLLGLRHAAKHFQKKQSAGRSEAQGGGA